jgi:hypothetical protein
MVVGCVDLASSDSRMSTVPGSDSAGNQSALAPQGHHADYCRAHCRRDRDKGFSENEPAADLPRLRTRKLYFERAQRASCHPELVIQIVAETFFSPA